MPRNDNQQPGWKKFVFKWLHSTVGVSLWYYFSVSTGLRELLEILTFDLQIEGRKKMWLSGTLEQAQASAYAIHHLETTVKDPITREKLRPLINLDANESWCLTTGIRCSINQRETHHDKHSESPRMALSRKPAQL